MEVKMFTQMVMIDNAGRITLPKKILQALKIAPKTVVILEVTDKEEILIKPKKTSLSITEKIAAMNLPVANWLEMEQEIEAGRMN
jgi:bifunctional DNA-binding transcriptional regulator/antitoxin component of YhaV-PrlF toxin-antitoxin module